MHDFEIKNVMISDVVIDTEHCQVDGGLSGEYLVLRQGAINSDGTINLSKTKSIRVKNGFVLS